MSNIVSKSFVIAALALTSLGLGAAPGVAADLNYGYGDAPPPVEEQKVEFGSGWYIRGDLGGTSGLSVRTNDDPYFGSHLGPGLTPPTLGASTSNQWSYNATLGGGYQFNRWFRSDMTVDFLQPQSSTHAGAARACWTGETATGADIDGQCTPTLRASLKSYAAMINGYIDLGKWGLFTPYIGAGVGLSFGNGQASASYLMNNGEPYNVKITDPTTGATYKQYWNRTAGLQYYNFAYALMAGTAIDVWDNTKLDIGYRYLSLGSVLGTKLNLQEVRVGARYMIDN